VDDPEPLQAFRSLRSRVETERIEIPWNPVLVTELQRVRTKYSGGGQTVQIGRSGDSHGDLAVALALGVNELDDNSSGPRKARLSRPSGILRVA
jgi:phage FluMu gp28-like protein